MLVVGKKDADLPWETAQSSLSFFYNYVYTKSPAARSLYKAYNNPNKIDDLGKNLIGNTQLAAIGEKFVK